MTYLSFSGVLLFYVTIQEEESSLVEFGINRHITNEHTTGSGGVIPEEKRRLFHSSGSHRRNPRLLREGPTDQKRQFIPRTQDHTANSLSLNIGKVNSILVMGHSSGMGNEGTRKLRLPAAVQVGELNSACCWVAVEETSFICSDHTTQSRAQQNQP